jgi:hypothetical protein
VTSAIWVCGGDGEVAPHPARTLAVSTNVDARKLVIRFSERDDT